MLELLLAAPTGGRYQFLTHVRDGSCGSNVVADICYLLSFSGPTRTNILCGVESAELKGKVRASSVLDLVSKMEEFF